MHRQAFARRPEGRLELDFCFSCQLIWLDEYESSQLTAGATLELFRQIHAHPTASTHPVPDRVSCPTCRGSLKLVHDIQRTNKFMYYRCHARHGRLITFFHFLREKQFVRSLSGAEITRLQATVKQVRCSSCGGPVSVEKDAACAYCKAPLSILDADAMQKTLAALDAAERNAVRVPDVQVASIDSLIAGRRVEQRLAKFDSDRSAGMDLVLDAIHLFMRHL